MEKGFTLVIPLYNKVNALRTTLDSVLNNHGEYPFKCIIVDDDSTDGSTEIAEEYDRNYPSVFMYIKKKHRGHKSPVSARNLGIKLAETEYIGFLDADDELCPGFIDRGCTFLDEHPEYSLYGNNNINHYINENNETWYNTGYLGNNNKTILNTFLDYYMSSPSIHFCANVYKTKLVKENLFTDNYCEDVVFLYKYVYKNEPVYIDTSVYDTIIWHAEHRGCYWNNRKTNYDYVMDEIFESVKNEIPNFKYEFHRDGEILYLYEKHN